MGLRHIFFDTYAMIELVQKNEKYMKYADFDLITSQQNMVEFYYHLYSSLGEGHAKRVYFQFYGGVVPINDFIIFKVCEFRKRHKKKRFSYVDCIGYVYAFENGIKFLTGDKEFKGMNNVEFVR